LQSFPRDKTGTPTDAAGEGGRVAYERKDQQVYRELEAFHNPTTCPEEATGPGPGSRHQQQFIVLGAHGGSTSSCKSSNPDQSGLRILHLRLSAEGIMIECARETFEQFNSEKSGKIMDD